MHTMPLAFYLEMILYGFRQTGNETKAPKMSKYRNALCAGFPPRKPLHNTTTRRGATPSTQKMLLVQTLAAESATPLNAILVD